MTYLENNNILYDLQHGFRKSRSCESQLLQFIQEFSKNNNKNIQTDLIIMDFAKEFDNTLLWIKAFLSYRTQKVVVNGISSITVPVTSGVPGAVAIIRQSDSPTVR
jgi:hypothetical protein